MGPLPSPGIDLQLFLVSSRMFVWPRISIAKAPHDETDERMFTVMLLTSVNIINSITPSLTLNPRLCDSKVFSCTIP